MFHLPIPIPNQIKTKQKQQLQNVLSEFDFLHDVDRQLRPLQMPTTISATSITMVPPPTQPPPPIPNAHQPVYTPSTPPISQHHAMMSAVTSLPPVILMGGGGSPQHYANTGIVEMPPSPATSQVMYVEFPDDEVDDARTSNVPNFVEVSIRYHTICIFKSLLSYAYCFCSCCRIQFFRVHFAFIIAHL